MKKILLIRILPLVVFLTTVLFGCKKFLDVKPKGRDIPAKIEHYDGMFNNSLLTQVNYTQVSSLGTKLLENTLYNIFMTDELMATKTSSGFMDYMVTQAYSWMPDIFNEEDNACEWATMYQQIYTYNVIANEVLNAEGGSTELKNQLLAEARASRALRYLVLAQYFGKPYDNATAPSDLCVPIITEADLNRKGLNRNTVKEVYDFVINELEESCPVLKKTTYHPLRVAQSAGWFFLGKAYWYKGDYENARLALLKALETSQDNAIGLTLYDYNTMVAQWGYKAATPYSWTTGFPANNNGANKEVIYNLQYSVSSITSSADAVLFVKAPYLSVYSANDQRRKFFSDRNRTNVAMEGFRRLPARTVFSLGADMPDLYLMLIECQARSANPTVQLEARSNLVEFRKKRMPLAEANIPVAVATQEALIRFVVQERQREYLMTGMRWFDIRRLWNDPLFQEDKANYTHTDGVKAYSLSANRLVYRIPPKIKVFHPEWKDNE
uniref:RagB/SusD family nutrient uptake outer membrane protein n=1 Tax=Pedobacter schmidteae TaxID=2201271 RepID=UPI000EB509E7|nr:RagB/SusD family nutrient uptake outer membrane protein [Pedobacter schmidteae]